MVTITLEVQNLNVSLQVGDLIYTTKPSMVLGGEDLNSLATVGSNLLVGVLRRITRENGVIVLDVDETEFNNTIVPTPGSFIMFSKWDQTDGDVAGYYAEVKFKNNSTEEAELFSIGSEIVINSK